MREHPNLMSELFTSAHLMLVDESLNVVMADHLETAYKAPEADPETEQAEAGE